MDKKWFRVRAYFHHRIWTIQKRGWWQAARAASWALLHGANCVHYEEVE
jgi:hypothetical protein